MKRLELSGNPNLRDLLREARRLGCHVEPVRRTGETDVQAPDGGPPVRVNVRRKDGSKALVGLLRRVQAEG